MANYSNYLHTYSEYVDSAPNLNEGDHYKDDIFNQRVQKAIDNLITKENAFANQFGYPDCVSLIKAIQELFKGDFSKDLEVLQRFKSDNLRAALHHKFDNNTVDLEGKKVRLVLNSDKSVEQLYEIKHRLEKALNFSFGSRDFKVTGNSKGGTEINIGIDWNVPNIKRVVNAVQGKHFVYNSSKRGKSQDISQTSYYLVDYLQNSPDAIVKLVNKKGRPSNYEFRMSGIAYKGSELANLDDATKTRMLNEIENFIINDLGAGASTEMGEAINDVLNPLIKNVGLKFFMGGKNWVEFLVGALGEFITPVFFYYCNKRLPNSNHLAPTFMELVGQDLNRFGEQRSIDIEIAFLKAAGIQVKNYNGAFVKDQFHQDTSKKRTVDVNLHPSDISSLGGDESIVTYIVNSYFNTSISPIPDFILEQFFKNHAYEFLNLAIDDAQIEDRATFYLIGGYLLPGSEILRSGFLETSTDKMITVSKTTMKYSGPEGKSDEEYNPWLSTSGGEHLYYKYWHPNNVPVNGKGDFSPTADNTITSWEKNITLHTSFTFSTLFRAEYKLF